MKTPVSQLWLQQRGQAQGEIQQEQLILQWVTPVEKPGFRPKQTWVHIAFLLLTLWRWASSVSLLILSFLTVKWSGDAYMDCEG